MINYLQRDIDPSVHFGNLIKWINDHNQSIIDFDNKGIGIMSPYYINAHDYQDKGYEYQKIYNFILEYINKYAIEHNIPSEKISLEFINYGKYSLVYVMSYDDNHITLTVKQPLIWYGKLKEEMDNLIELHKMDSHVICPFDYYTNEGQELYATEYINQARCIATDEEWGIYVPEPIYHFEKFTPEEKKIINTAMIAKLVKLYDGEKELGISKCRLNGGDFILPKDFRDDMSLEGIYNKLILIAARERVKYPFDHYLNIVETEFYRRPFYDNPDTSIVNNCGKVPMSLDEICDGINYGIEMRKKDILVRERKNN